MNDLDAMIEKVVDELTQKDSDDAPSCNWCWVCPDCRTRVVQQIVGNGASRVGAGPNLGPIHSELAALIDHTLLKPDATEEQITKLCEEAAQCGFASVCVNPCWVRLCRDLLRGSKVKVCTVIGFPLGATTCESKAFETQTAIEHGADEIDMVINIGKLKSGDYDYLERDIRAVVETTKTRGIVKVILETCLLTDEEKIKGSLLAKRAGAAFVKTSTGFSKGGATLGDVALMRKVVGSNVGVKASGGVRDRESAVKMVEAGATRLGASASVTIVS